MGSKKAKKTSSGSNPVAPEPEVLDEAPEIEMELPGKPEKASGSVAGVLTGKDPHQKFNLDFDLFDATQNYSVEYLFGNLEGAPLVDSILEWFVVEEANIPFYFTDTGGTVCRTIVRSPLSRPIQEKTVSVYKQRIFKEGLGQRVAGVVSG